MLRHVVLMRFRAGSPEGAVDAVVEALRALQDQIPELLAISVGPDLGVLPNPCDLAIVADFADRDDYLVYAAHPAHLQVIERLIDPFVSERYRAQIELDG